MLCAVAHLSAFKYYVILARVTRSLDFQKYAMDDPLWPVVRLGDKIADLLEYFLSSLPEFSSTLDDKWLKMYVVHVFVRLKVLGNLCIFSHFCSVM